MSSSTTLETSAHRQKKNHPSSAGPERRSPLTGEAELLLALALVPLDSVLLPHWLPAAHPTTSLPVVQEMRPMPRRTLPTTWTALGRSMRRTLQTTEHFWAALVVPVSVLVQRLRIDHTSLSMKDPEAAGVTRAVLVPAPAELRVAQP
jgi:hypothetical protein